MRAQVAHPGYQEGQYRENEYEAIEWIATTLFLVQVDRFEAFVEFRRCPPVVSANFEKGGSPFCSVETIRLTFVTEAAD